MVSSALNYRLLITPPPFTLIESNRRFNLLLPYLLSIPPPPTPLYRPQQTTSRGISCLNPSSFSPPPTTTFNPSTRLYVSGLSFRTTEESLRNAFKNFGELIEVNLVMDRIANRPRGFAFLKYSSEEESKKAIEGMHGKPNLELKFAKNSRENPDRAEFIRGRLGHRVKTKAFKIMSLLANRAGYASYPI